MLLYTLICGDVPFHDDVEIIAARLSFTRSQHFRSTVNISTYPYIYISTVYISTYLHLRLVSGSCSDLVRRCLALRPQNRIGLDQILRSVDFQDLRSRMTHFSHIQASLDHFLRTLGAPLLYNHDEGGVISGAAETAA